MSYQTFTSAFNDLLFERIVHSPDRINLSSGNPSYAPFQLAIDASLDAVQRSNVQLYATGAGYKTERSKVLPFCEGQGLHQAKVENIVFGLGITHLYNTALTILRRKFDKDLNGKKPVILMSAPSYGLFTIQPDMLGYNVETFPLFQEDHWEPRPEVIEQRIQQINQSGDKKVVLVYNINPHNPTGSIAKPETTEKLANLFTKLEVFMLDDLAYYGLEYTRKPVPLGAYQFENSLSFYSCSKAFGLPRLRAGFACGPAWLTTEIYHHISAQMIALPSTVSPIINACFGENYKVQVAEYIQTNKEGYKSALNLVRAFLGGVESFALPGPERDEVVKTIRNVVANKKISETICEQGIPEIEMINPDLEAGYFAMIRIKGIDEHFYGTRRLRNAFELAVPLIDHAGVLVLPLSCAVDQIHTDACRITFGGMSNRRVVKGLQRMVNTIRALPTSPDNNTQKELVAANLQIDGRFDLK